MEDVNQRLNAEDIETLLDSQMTEVIGGGDHEELPTEPGGNCTCGIAFAKS